MSTLIRPELSKTNEYWIPKHRYYELKHFCLQYPYWKRMCLTSDALVPSPSRMTVPKDKNKISDPTASYAIRKSSYAKCMSLVVDSVRKTDLALSKYLLKAVTEGFSYEYLSTTLGIPCSRDTYYDRYRRFFWILDQVRD